MIPYIALKHLHVTFVAISVLLFVLRFVWRERQMAVAQQKWVKIVPHIVDTLLLLTIVGMLWHWQAWPWSSMWLMGKTVGLLGYIGLGVLTMKAKQPKVRWSAFVLTLVWLAGLAHFAIAKI